MSITKNIGLVRRVQKAIYGGMEKRNPLPTPETRFHLLGTIFSRTTGLIKSGVLPADDAPIWYSLYKTFPPKYEPAYTRPPLDVDVKEIYYPEDKLRAAMKKWEIFDLKSTELNHTQKLVDTYRERRKTHGNDQKLIAEILDTPTTGKN